MIKKSTLCLSLLILQCSVCTTRDTLVPKSAEHPTTLVPVVVRDRRSGRPVEGARVSLRHRTQGAYGQDDSYSSEFSFWMRKDPPHRDPYTEYGYTDSTGVAHVPKRILASSALRVQADGYRIFFDYSKLRQLTTQPYPVELEAPESARVRILMPSGSLLPNQAIRLWGNKGTALDLQTGDDGMVDFLPQREPRPRTRADA